MDAETESEKPMSHGGVATQKVFASPKCFLRFATKSTIKRHAKIHRLPDGLETFLDDLETFHMVRKLSGWSIKFLDGLETFRMF